MAKRIYIKIAVSEENRERYHEAIAESVYPTLSAYVKIKLEELCNEKHSD